MLRFDFVNDKFAVNDIMILASGECLKRPVKHKYFVAKQAIEFQTKSGKQYANPGDYVIIAKDHAWPVSKEYFHEHYAEHAHELEF